MFRDHFVLRGTPEQNALVLQALDRVKYPDLALKLQVPVYFKDLSAYNSQIHDDHVHVHGDGVAAHGIAKAGATAGLFWWRYSANTVVEAWIEVGTGFPPEFQKEVFLAEAAHAFDMTGVQWGDVQRGQLYDAFHDKPLGTTGPIPWSYQGSGSHPHGWFGPQGYYDTPGESFMATFVEGVTDMEFSGPDRWSHDGDREAVVQVFVNLIGKGQEETSMLMQFMVELNKSTLFQKWATANPNEYRRLVDFYQSAGARPAMVTPFGRAMALAVEGLR